jgi:hypothetical protein
MNGTELLREASCLANDGTGQFVSREEGTETSSIAAVFHVAARAGTRASHTIGGSVCASMSHDALSAAHGRFRAGMMRAAHQSDAREGETDDDNRDDFPRGR